MRIWVHRFCFGLVLGSTLVPTFYSADYLYGFISLKSFIFRALTVLLVIGCLYLVKTSRVVSLRLNLYLLSWIGLLGWLLFTSLTGADPERSLWSTFERMDGFIGYIWLFLYLACLPVLIRTQRDWRWLISLSCGVAVVIALFSLTGKSEWYTPHGRLFLTFGNPAAATAYYGFHVFFVCLLTKQLLDQNPDKKWLILVGAGITFSLFLTICIQTQSRSIIISVLLSFAGLSIYLASKLFRSFRRRALFLVIVVVGLFTVTNTYYSYSEPSGLFEIGAERSSLQARIDTWQFAWEGICQKPLLGWGLDNFGYAMTPTFAHRSHSDELWYDRAHNAFLEWGISAGWLGLLGYLSLFMAMFYRSAKTRRITTEVAIMIVALVFYVVSHMANIDTLTTSICLVWTFAFLDQHLPKAFSISISKEKVPMSLVFMVVSLLVGTLSYFSVWQPARTNQRILQLLRSSQPTYVARELTFLYQNTIQGKYEIAEQMALMAVDLEAGSTDSHEKENFYNATYQILADQYRIRPQFMRFLDVVGAFLKRYPSSEARKKSVKMYQIMATQMPLRAESNYGYGLSLWENNVDSSAHKAMLRAVHIKPNDSRFLLGLALVNATSDSLPEFAKVIRKVPVRYVAEHFSELRSNCSEKTWKVVHEFFQQNLLPEHTSPMPPLFYWQWAHTSFDIGDFATCKAALYMYYTFYGKNPLVLTIREEVDKGVRPPEIRISQ